MNETFTPPAELNAASQLLSLISLLADRDATKRLLDRLVGASKAALDACEKLGDARAAQAAVEKERQAFVKWMDAERAKLKDEHALLSADKHLLVWGERGSLLALKATPDAYTAVGELPDLLKYRSWAMPALADGRLYLRDQGHLLCLDLRRK